MRNYEDWADVDVERFKTMRYLARSSRSLRHDRLHRRRLERAWQRAAQFAEHR